MSCIVTNEYLQRGDILRAYLQVTERSRAEAELNGKVYAESSNRDEPYDFRLHYFDLPAAELRAAGGYTVRLYDRENKLIAEETAEFTEEKIVSEETAKTRPDRHLAYRGILEQGEDSGVAYTVETYETPDGAPVRVYTAVCDLTKVRVLAGTPNAEPVFRPQVIQTVMEEAEAFIARGETVLAASNADFFDMFGDCHPSGVCVSGGTVVANPDSPNPFFGITKTGEPVIGYLKDYPADTLAEAVGGGQIIVKNGAVADIAPLEPFGEIAHPRTAFGITADGKVLIVIVDGRRPVWSNGAALCELAQILIAHGAVTAINSDGGGSSTIIVRKDGALTMLNHPADLLRPMEDLVRPLFDSVIVVKR